MFTDVEIINMGLGRLSSSRVSRIDPPQTPLERFIAGNYAHWKRSELTKRRWVFAMEDNYALPKVAELTGVERPYVYELPVNCLRPVRSYRSDWVQRGRKIYSATDGLKISFIDNKKETEFDPLFVEVLAARIAMDSAEHVTQSNTKKADAKDAYKEAVEVAGQCNAYVIGPEDISSTDEDYPFLTARW